MRFQPFKETERIHNFSCGDKDLDDFLNTKEVENYEHEQVGITQMVFYRGEFIAYFTLSFSELRREYIKGLKSFSILRKVDLESYPAIKIGRLAVKTEWQRKGVGSALLKYIAALGLETRVRGGLRLLIVEAEPKPRGFYEKFGFILTNEIGRERKKVHRTMFFDLGALDDVVKPG